jgi:drug/metabolite transporter (DMT)-like permease
MRFGGLGDVLLALGSGPMKVALALVAALLVGVGLVLQQHAAEQAPKSYFLHLRLIAELLHKRRWLAGIGIMAAGEILSAWTIGNLDLGLAEPLLATSLIFALLFAVPLAGERLRRSEILGALLLSGGVAALSLSRSVGVGGERFGSAAYWPAAAVIGFIALSLVRTGWRRPGPTRATLTGVASGLIFGISDALTRSTLEIVDHHGVLAVLVTWPAYSLAAASLVALWLMESAFNSAPLHSSLPGITAAEPVVGILLGVLVFGDVIRDSPGLIALQAAGIVMLVAGVVLVARAPALSGLRPARLGRGEPGILPEPETPGKPGSAGGRAEPAAGDLAAVAELDGRPARERPAPE